MTSYKRQLGQDNLKKTTWNKDDGASCTFGKFRERFAGSAFSKSVWICSVRAQSGFSEGIDSQKIYLWIYAGIYNILYWSERPNEPKPSQCTFSSCPHRIFGHRDISTCGISQPTLSRIMPAVLDAIISLAPIYIQFPLIPRHRWIRKYNWSHIDCTHITIKAQSHNEFSYVNRKGLNLINTQII